MDGCGILMFLMIVIFIIAIPFTIKQMSKHKAEAIELSEEYNRAIYRRDLLQIISTARAAIEFRKRNTVLDLPDEAGRIYRDILGLLKEMPQLKPFALEAGRVAYGSQRKDKKATIYDEQAIMNDINAHT